MTQAIDRDFATSDVVIYDGDCIFCTASINILRRLDGQGRLRFLSLHDPSVRVDYPDLTHDMLMSEMWVVAFNGDRYSGADALKYLSLRLPLLYPIAPMLYIPGSMPIWRRFYRFVARNRYRIAGSDCSDGTCRFHGRKR
jgi:predicted DCC family thiol-disulfide oxidoreductase YuxK